MLDLLRLIWCLVIGLFRSRAALQAEILVLRHQLNVLRRKSPKRLVFSNIDRLVFAGLCGLIPSVRNALKNAQACDRDRMASRWSASLSALEITAARRPARRIG